MGLILFIVVIFLIFGGGGGYYAHRSYGLPGLGGPDLSKFLKK